MATLTAKQINTKITALRTSELKSRDRIQELLVATREHAMEHGDLTLLSRLVMVLREVKSRNVKAITQYFIDHTKGIKWTDNKVGYKKIKDETIEFLELTETWYDYKANQGSQQVAKVDVVSRAKSLLTTLTKALADGNIKEGQTEQAKQLAQALQAFKA